mgnify:CR=1 FL=1
MSAPHGKASFTTLTIGALGVVFGDIGTSPLYTLRQCLVEGHKEGAATHDEVLGLLSLIFWALTLVVTIKYLTFIMRADNHGEGGIFALLALVARDEKTGKRLAGIAVLTVIGAALLYGDGAITPAISVLSAIEGLTELDHEWDRFVVPITIIILIVLFAVQSRGTGVVGRFFGPVMLVWFATIAGLGIWHIAQKPEVLLAVNPVHGATYFMTHDMTGFLVLGAVVLAVTGGEALYADMGHFGIKPIRAAWLALVMPSLLLCYFGQGALVLRDPETASHPFFAMVPRGPATVALVILSSLATVIASQALISGAFSLTRQAQQLGYFPRVTVRHTDAQTQGQIYIPEINWILAVGCFLLVLGFRKSERLAAAYGIAVTGTMILTSIVFFVVMRRAWKWRLPVALLVLTLFLSVDLPFFAANTAKILEGGWVPVLIGFGFVVAMLIWNRGRRLLGLELAKRGKPLESGLQRLGEHVVARVPGASVFLTTSTKHVPPVLMHIVERTRALHELVILVTVEIEPKPTVPETERYELSELRPGFKRMVVHYGFMEDPDVPGVLAAASEKHALKLELENITYFLGREAVLAHETGRMGRLSESIFAFLNRNAVAADAVFGIPPKQVVEVGLQVDL